MINIKTKSYLIMGAWALYVSYVYFYQKSLINMITKSSFMMGTGIYLLTNPAYLLLIYFVIKSAKNSKVRATISSIIMIFALDIVSFPRIFMSEIFSTSSSVVSNMGAIAIKSLVGIGLGQGLSFFLYYWFTPLALMWFALELGGYINFVKSIGNGGV